MVQPKRVTDEHPALPHNIQSANRSCQLSCQHRRTMRRSEYAEHNLVPANNHEAAGEVTRQRNRPNLAESPPVFTSAGRGSSGGSLSSHGSSPSGYAYPNSTSSSLGYGSAGANGSSECVRCNERVSIININELFTIKCGPCGWSWSGFEVQFAMMRSGVRPTITSMSCARLQSLTHHQSVGQQEARSHQNVMVLQAKGLPLRTLIKAPSLHRDARPSGRPD